VGGGVVVVVVASTGKPLRLASSICWGVRASFGQQILGTEKPNEASFPHAYTSFMIRGTAFGKGFLRLLSINPKGPQDV